MSTNHIEPYKTFKIEKRDKECVLGNYQKDIYIKVFHVWLLYGHKSIRTLIMAIIKYHLCLAQGAH